MGEVVEVPKQKMVLTVRYPYIKQPARLKEYAEKEYKDIHRSLKHGIKTARSLKYGEEQGYGCRLIMEGKIFDIGKALYTQLKDSEHARKIPTFHRVPRRISDYSDGKVNLKVSAIERCLIDGRPVESHEATNMKQALYLLNMYRDSKPFNLEKFKRYGLESDVVKQSTTTPTIPPLAYLGSAGSRVPKNEIVEQSTISPTITGSSSVLPSSGSVNKFPINPPPIEYQPSGGSLVNDVVKQSTISPTTISLAGNELELLSNLEYLPLIYNLLLSMKELMASGQSISPAGADAIGHMASMVKAASPSTHTETVTEIVVKDERFNTKIDMTEDAEQFLLIMFASLDRHIASGKSARVSYQLVHQEMYIEGSEFSNYRLAFQSGRRGNKNVTVANITYYYTTRYMVVNGRIEMNPKADEINAKNSQKRKQK